MFQSWRVTSFVLMAIWPSFGLCSQESAFLGSKSGGGSSDNDASSWVGGAPSPAASVIPDPLVVAPAAVPETTSRPQVATAPPCGVPSPDETCDISTSGPICLGGQVLLPPAMLPGLVGHWSFDGTSVADVSGNGHHGALIVTAGPSFAGQGSSAYFRKSFLMIPAADDLSLATFSYTFWLYLVDHHAGHSQGVGGLRLCPIIRKGLDSAMQNFQDGSVFASAPTIFIDRMTRRLRVELAVTSDGGSGSSEVVEALDSNAQLGFGRWFHVALVRLDGQRQTRLYVNGILDKSAKSSGFIRTNKDPLYVGSDPVARHQCDVPVYIDELKVYDRALRPDEIQAEAAPALAGVEPSFLRLACISCPLEEAMQNCPDGYHICNSLELHMGGYQVARALGWLQQSSHVWSHTPVTNAALQSHGGFGPFAHNSMPAPGPAPVPEFGTSATQSSAEMVVAGATAVAAAATARARSGPAPAPAVQSPGPAGPGFGLGICCADELGD